MGMVKGSNIERFDGAEIIAAEEQGRGLLLS